MEHENIVGLHDVLQTNNNMYIITEVGVLQLMIHIFLQKDFLVEHTPALILRV